MQVKFTGFKVAPFRNHIIIETGGKHTKMCVNEVMDLPEEDAFRLRATGQFEIIDIAKDAAKLPGRVSHVQQPPHAQNRAILDGKAE